MGRSVSRRRPWLAALLAALVTGLGHLYLRRWRRAIGWLAASFGASALFVEPSAIDELASGSASLDAVTAAAPLLLVVGLSVVDAYRIARHRSDVDDATDATQQDSIDCPHCGHEVDPDLDFCHWCTQSIEDVDGDRPEPSDGA